MRLIQRLPLPIPVRIARPIADDMLSLNLSRACETTLISETFFLLRVVMMTGDRSKVTRRSPIRRRRESKTTSAPLKPRRRRPFHRFVVRSSSFLRSNLFLANTSVGSASSKLLVLLLALLAIIVFLESRFHIGWQILVHHSQIGVDPSINEKRR